MLQDFPSCGYVQKRGGPHGESNFLFQTIRRARSYKAWIAPRHGPVALHSFFIPDEGPRTRVETAVVKQLRPKPFSLPPLPKNALHPPTPVAASTTTTSTPFTHPYLNILNLPPCFMLQTAATTNPNPFLSLSLSLSLSVNSEIAGSVAWPAPTKYVLNSPVVTMTECSIACELA